MDIGTRDTLCFDIEMYTSPESDLDETSLRLFVDGHCLTVGEDDAGNPSDKIEKVELRDIAAWFAYCWDALMDESCVHRGFPSLGNLAQQYMDTKEIPSDALYTWAETHCLEFACSYFCLPHVVFQRRGDMMNISWASRPGGAIPWDDYTFYSDPGEANLPVATFQTVVLDLLRFVLEEYADAHGGKDSRVEMCRSTLLKFSGSTR